MLASHPFDQYDFVKRSAAARGGLQSSAQHDDRIGRLDHIVHDPRLRGGPTGSKSSLKPRLRSIEESTFGWRARLDGYMIHFSEKSPVRVAPARLSGPGGLAHSLL